jgi:uncharacterized protein
MNRTFEEILRATAEVVGELPALRGVVSPERLFRERSADLLKALATGTEIRRRVRAALPGSHSDLARLVLHDDEVVHRIGVRQAEAAEDKRSGRELKQLERQLAETRARLRTARGRLDYAVLDRDAAKAELGSVKAALIDSEERAEALTDELRAVRQRMKDPHVVASALRALLMARPVTSEDASTRDPHSEPIAPEPSALAAACGEAGIGEHVFLAVLDALVNPAPPPMAEIVELDLRVTPLGGGTEIGGSCVLIEAGHTRILVDAGLKPGDFPTPPKGIAVALDGRLDALIVTHAHVDHCGYAPALVRHSPGMRLIATRETAQLMPVMWRDCVKVMSHRVDDDAVWGSHREPLYGHAEVTEAAARLEDVAFGCSFRVGELGIELFPAGHILGAAGVVVRAGDRRVVVTGDISGFRQESVDSHTLPEAARGADLLLIETTCCGENHDSREARVGDLIGAVEEVWEAGGRVLIPAFALGRAQEVALLVRKHLPQVPLLVDGMARELSETFEQLTTGSGRPLSIFGDKARPARRPADLDRFRRGVVITTSGMLNGGPAVQWATRILPDPGSALFLSGYQDEESGGRRLLALAEAGCGDFDLDGFDGPQKVKVRASVRPMRLSAHADRQGLREIVDEISPQHTMLVHGVPGNQRQFADLLRLRRHDVVPTGLWSY